MNFTGWTLATVAALAYVVTLHLKASYWRRRSIFWEDFARGCYLQIAEQEEQP